MKNFYMVSVAAVLSGLAMSEAHASWKQNFTFDLDPNALPAARAPAPQPSIVNPQVALNQLVLPGANARAVQPRVNPVARPNLQGFVFDLPGLGIVNQASPNAVGGQAQILGLERLDTIDAAEGLELISAAIGGDDLPTGVTEIYNRTNAILELLDLNSLVDAPEGQRAPTLLERLGGIHNRLHELQEFHAQQNNAAGEEARLLEEAQAQGNPEPNALELLDEAAHRAADAAHNAAADEARQANAAPVGQPQGIVVPGPGFEQAQQRLEAHLQPGAQQPVVQQPAVQPVQQEVARLEEGARQAEIARLDERARLREEARLREVARLDEARLREVDRRQAGEAAARRAAETEAARLEQIAEQARAALAGQLHMGLGLPADLQEQVAAVDTARNAAAQARQAEAARQQPQVNNVVAVADDNDNE